MIQNDLLVNVGGGGEIIRIAANVLAVRVLVDTDPVDFHRRGECEVFKIDEAKVPRHSQVGDEVLNTEDRMSISPALTEHWCAHHRLLWDRTRANLDSSISRHTRLVQLPDHLAVSNPSDVLSDI